MRWRFAVLFGALLALGPVPGASGASDAGCARFEPVGRPPVEGARAINETLEIRLRYTQPAGCGLPSDPTCPTASWRTVRFDVGAPEWTEAYFTNEQGERIEERELEWRQDSPGDASADANLVVRVTAMTAAYFRGGVLAVAKTCHGANAQYKTNITMAPMPSVNVTFAGGWEKTKAFWDATVHNTGNARMNVSADLLYYADGAQGRTDDVFDMFLHSKWDPWTTPTNRTARIMLEKAHNWDRVMLRVAMRDEGPRGLGFNESVMVHVPMPPRSAGFNDRPSVLVAIVGSAAGIALTLGLLLSRGKRI